MRFWNHFIVIWTFHFELSFGVLDFDVFECLFWNLSVVKTIANSLSASFKKSKTVSLLDDGEGCRKRNFDDKFNMLVTDLLRLKSHQRPFPTSVNNIVVTSYYFTCADFSVKSAAATHFGILWDFSPRSKKSRFEIFKSFLYI